MKDRQVVCTISNDQSNSLTQAMPELLSRQNSHRLSISVVEPSSRNDSPYENDSSELTGLLRPLRVMAPSCKRNEVYASVRCQSSPEKIFFAGNPAIRTFDAFDLSVFIARPTGHAGRSVRAA